MLAALALYDKALKPVFVKMFCSLELFPDGHVLHIHT